MPPVALVRMLRIPGDERGKSIGNVSIYVYASSVRRWITGKGLEIGTHRFPRMVDATTSSPKEGQHALRVPRNVVLGQDGMDNKAGNKKKGGKKAQGER
jgi:hypothetical protein